MQNLQRNRLFYLTERLRNALSLPTFEWSPTKPKKKTLIKEATKMKLSMHTSPRTNQCFAITASNGSPTSAASGRRNHKSQRGLQETSSSRLSQNMLRSTKLLIAMSCPHSVSSRLRAPSSQQILSLPTTSPRPTPTTRRPFLSWSKKSTLTAIQS